jgi:hypothetical protein
MFHPRELDPERSARDAETLRFVEQEPLVQREDAARSVDWRAQHLRFERQLLMTIASALIVAVRPEEQESRLPFFEGLRRDWLRGTVSLSLIA